VLIPVEHVEGPLVSCGVSRCVMVRISETSELLFRTQDHFDAWRESLDRETSTGFLGVVA